MATDLDVSASPAADPSVGRTGPARPTWRRSLVIAVAVAAAAAAGVVAVRAVTADDGPIPVVPAGRPPATAPLISPAEQKFMNAMNGRVPLVRAEADASCAPNGRC
jgi:hypothetical protein